MRTMDLSLDNPAAVTALLAGLLEDGPGAVPPLKYLRRKAGRGLVAVYGAAGRSGGPFTVSVPESALTGTGGRGAAVDALHWQGHWPGMVSEPTLGLAVQAFPVDRSLPALAQAVDPAASPHLWSALQSCGSAALPDGTAWTLRVAEAEPVRYKPGDRCVLRYRLEFARPDSDRPVRTSVIGKLYGRTEQAVAAHALLTRLHGAATDTLQPATPKPLACVDSLALVLSEDLGDQGGDPPTRTGLDVIRPGSAQADATIVAAARALAALQTGEFGPPATGSRRGADEAVKAGKRAEVLAAYLPASAPAIAAIAREVCDRLRALEPPRERPTHGSYKPSQLLVRDGAVFIVDFDQFGSADPALDVGYFLAYLRPPGLFYRRSGTRDWFEAAATTFRTAYREAMQARGVPAAEVAAVLDRSAVYEAALLLKIAARRANRLHSPRAGELHAILDEIGAVLRIR